MRISPAAILIVGAVLLTPAVPQHQAAYRTIKIETNEVTQPAVAVSADGQTLIFTALGQLVQVPVSGGPTTQLTTGPSYHTDPAVSPDGRRVAFTSNRDGSGSNIFLLELATGRVTPLTRDLESGRAAWSPDGQTIAYARNIPREDHPMELVPGFGDTGLRELRTIPASGGPSTVVASPQAFETVFHLADGRLAWTVRDLAAGGMMGPQVRQTRIETRAADGSVIVLATSQGDIGRVVPGPKGDGVYHVARGSVQWQPFGPGATATAGPRIQDGGSRLAVSRDGRAVYFGDRGQLWRAALPSGDPQRIPFDAAIQLTVRPQVEAKWQAPPSMPTATPVRPVLAPHMSPDGTRIVVMAAGFLFEQPLTGAGAARQIVEGGGFSRDPIYSPDGRRLAYVVSEFGRRYLRVHDLGTRETKTLVTVGGAAWPLYPSWSPDGQRIVFQQAGNLGAPFPIVVVNIADGNSQPLTQTVGSWVARPHFSGDGRFVYFTNRSGKIGALYRIGLEPNAQPEALTDFTRHVHEGLVSPDGKWMAARRNSEIWIAPIGTLTTPPAPIRDAGLRRLSAEGGRSFSFTSDSSAVLFIAGGRVFRQPVGGGPRTEIPVRITLERPVAPPLLVSRVRVLDLAAGRFTEETSIFVEGGRIRWIGAEQGRQIPSNVVRLDGGGRFAIPGLFDAHVHSAWQNQQTNEDAFLAFGVTSVRDTGSTLDLLTALDDRSNVTALPAPRYFYSGEIFEGMMPLWGDAFYTIGTEQEARAEVRNLKAWGADFVKIYPSVPWHLQGTIADEAHRVGLPVVGHGLSTEEVIRRVLWGSTSLEHGNSVTGVYGDVHKMLAAAGTAADLTIAMFNGGLTAASEPEWQKNWRVLEYVPEDARRAAGGAAGGRGGGRGGPGGGPQTREQALAASKGQFDRVRSARNVGVTMTGGTDSLMGGVYFGLSLHWEIAHFADAGVPPIDVLRMATEGGAKLVGASADLGSLAPGKLGDIVLLEADPLENIRNTQKIWQVVKGGRVYDPTKLRPGLEATAGR